MMRTRRSVLISAIALSLVLLTLGSCAGDGPDAQNAQVAEEPAALSLEPAGDDGVLECRDTETSPFEDGGVHVIVNRDEGVAEFIRLDGNGEDTVEYYKFSNDAKEVEEYHYVSMMGTGFYYYFDAEADKLMRIEDQNHQDVTQSSIDNNRFDSAETGMRADIAMLACYFEQHFGMSIAEAVRA